jgi:hypothetical protein
VVTLSERKFLEKGMLKMDPINERTNPIESADGLHPQPRENASSLGSYDVLEARLGTSRVQGTHHVLRSWASTLEHQVEKPLLSESRPRSSSLPCVESTANVESTTDTTRNFFASSIWLKTARNVGIEEDRMEDDEIVPQGEEDDNLSYIWKWKSRGDDEVLFGQEANKLSDEEFHEKVKRMLDEKTGALQDRKKLTEAVSVLQAEFGYALHVLVCIFLLRDAETVMELCETAKTEVLIPSKKEGDPSKCTRLGELFRSHFRGSDSRTQGGWEWNERTLADMAVYVGSEGLKVFRELAPALIEEKRWAVFETPFVCVDDKGVLLLRGETISREELRDAFRRYLGSDDMEKFDPKKNYFENLQILAALYLRHRPVRKLSKIIMSQHRKTIDANLPEKYQGNRFI